MIIAVNWSWAATEDLVSERREHARQLVGQCLASVTYVMIDYDRPDDFDVAQGPRLIADVTELAAPTWRYTALDSIDYGIELTAASGDVYTVSWDSPGRHTGIWIRKLPALGNACSDDASVALWDVSTVGRWDGFLGRAISDVALQYTPETDDGYWCDRIDLGINGYIVHLLLGDVSPDQQLIPSGDNIVVAFPPTEVP